MDEEERNARALTYLVVLFPILTVTIAAATWFFPLVWYVPKFEQMFKEMDIGALPPLTLFVCTLSNAIVKYWYMFFALYVLGIHLWISHLSKRRGKIVISPQSMILIATGFVMFELLSIQLIFWALMEPLVVIFQGVSGH